MASSNRHWPSMFKSKPCNTTHHQWQNDINPCHRSPYSPGHGCEERTPEPKPRWNPKPEQIRILEAIFNSGMVNPPRDEIRKIRAQLQEYGQVGDANVFYWFQNRKSRSKHKQRQLQTAAKTHHPPPPSATAPSSSSSSSNKSSPNNSSDKSIPATVIDLLNSPTASVNQPFFGASNEFLTEPFFFPVQQNTVGSSSQGFCFPDVTGVADENCPNYLLSELMLMSQSKKDDDEKMKLHHPFAYAPPVPPPFCAPSPTNQNFQGAGAGAGEAGPTKLTVFINDVCFEVGVGPFNVREAFGDDAVLIHSSGQTVVMNESGLTLHPLQHGGFYYLLRPFAPSPHDRTIDLI